VLNEAEESFHLTLAKILINWTPTQKEDLWDLWNLGSPFQPEERRNFVWQNAPLLREFFEMEKVAPPAGAYSLYGRQTNFDKSAN